MAYIAATGTGAIPTALAQVQPPSGTTSSNAGSNTGTSDPANSGVKKPSAYSWLIAWGVLLAALTLINRTKLGHAAIYYGLVLMLVFVILSNYRFIQTSLAPFNTLTAQGS